MWLESHGQPSVHYANTGVINGQMFRGIAPTVLLSQVCNTAEWMLEGDVENASHSWRRALCDLSNIAQAYEASWSYLRLLLAAHYVTVATFVPTDVDSHIRYHAWQRAHGNDVLRAAVDIVDETDVWDAHAVSARVVDIEGVGALSGHDGEWLSVRAGALGRALAINDEHTIERLVSRIDSELDRHDRAFQAVVRARGRELDALRVATVIAHNLGDLTRVVDEWPVKSSRAQELSVRYARLGHTDRKVGDARFVLVGHINKQVMALENHRFLALRTAKSLRVHRELLLPIGPFFDEWGATIARSKKIENGSEGRGAVVSALLEIHVQSPLQQGVLRALAGFHRAHRGGMDAVAADVPARLRKLLKAGAVREALGVDQERFEARLVNQYRAALESAQRA
jgi:hypothetical protein